jgi:hypothetical protein
MAVDNNCITITNVSQSTGKIGQNAVSLTVDFDIKLDATTPASSNKWTLSINPQSSGGQPNTQKVHYTFAQSDMAQILTSLNNIWSNQPS